MRLGYACINTSLSGTFRSCVLKSVQDKGIPFVREIVKANFYRVLRILEWNKEHDIRLYRLSSELIPFGSHSILEKWEWWRDEELISIASQCKEFAKSENMRITIHPGQFNNLSSPIGRVVKSTFRDLIYQTRLLEAFGGTDMILHIGGRYEGKRESIQRFKERFKMLPKQITQYLRIENDDKVYNMADVLDVCFDLKCKPMFDYHHDRCLPSIKIDEVKDSLSFLWGINRIKVHLSSGATHMRDRHHADYIDRETWESFTRDFEDMREIDVMLETKKKELSVLKAREYDLSRKGE